jgi:hypothetical protein
MKGIFLLLVIAAWVSVCISLARAVFTRMDQSWYGRLLATAVALVAIPLPLVDEILAAPKLRDLCAREARFELGSKDLIGRTVWYDKTVNENLNLSGIQVERQTSEYVFPGGSELAYRYTAFHARGGWLISKLGISESGSPLLFDGFCGPPDLQDFARTRKIRAEDKPKGT